MNQIKNFINRLHCSATTAIILIWALAIFYFNYGLGESRRKVAMSESAINLKIKEIVNFCGVERWVFWVTVEKNKYFFKDIYGCAPNKEDCAFDLIDLGLNPFYSRKDLTLDEESKTFLDKMEVGLAGYYTPEDLTKYSSMKEILMSSNKKAKSIGISVAKDIKHDVIYIFALTSTDLNQNKCDREKTVRLLEDLSLLATGSL